MKKAISIIMIAALVLLSGCTGAFPLNENLTTERTTAEETATVTQNQAPTTAVTTQPQTKPHTTAATTQKPTETTAQSTTQAPTTQEPTTDYINFIEEFFTDMSSAFQGNIPDEQDVDPNKPMLALTFDDGPSAYTDRLLDIFKMHGGKGTFFVVGTSVNSRPKTLKRIADEGHEIGSHCWNHPKLTTLDEREIAIQIARTNAKIIEVTGRGTNLVRPPYGAYNDTVKNVGKRLGVSYIVWSVDTLDWKSKNADAVYESVMGQAKNGSIILLHDLHKTTVDAMERVIPDLIEQGYQLVTVTQLLAANGNTLEAGKVYSGKR